MSQPFSRDTSRVDHSAASPNTIPISADRAQWIDYLIDQYRIDKRLDKPRPTLYRKRVNGEGTRYLVTSGNRAVFQCDDQLDALQYLIDHPGCKLHDLSDQHYFRRKAIGQYLGVREHGRTISPKLDPTTGRFGQITQALLCDLKTEAKLPEPKDATPFRVKLKAILRGQPIGTQNRAVPCSACGLTVSCQCAAHALRRDMPLQPVERREPGIPRTKPTVSTEDFIRQLRRDAGLRVE